MLEKQAILVVDDDADFGEILSLLLSASGYGVVVASEGAAALRHLHIGPTPALILLDLRMPGVDGAGFMREFQKSPWRGVIPVVVMSGEARGEQEAVSLGAEAYIAKPVEIDELLGTMRRLLVPQGESAAPPSG